MSNETKWTPGPWSRGAGCVIFAADGEPVARVDEDRDSVEELCTEHLIAAAPELYEALELMLYECEDDEFAPHVVEARAALNKARGGS